MLAAVLGIALVALAGSQASAAAFNPDPLFPVGPISGRVSHQIRPLDSVASALAGRHATVNCWSPRDWARLQAWRGAHHLRIDEDGVTFPETRRIQLSPFLCQVLEQVLARSAQQPLFTSYAITILAHESAHASGIRAENLAECRAIRTEPRAAQLFGIAKPVALRLQHIYRGTIYPNDLPEYRTPPCKAGLPGAVVPDTLGTAADLRPLRRAAAAVSRLLPGWRNLGGSVGPLNPCSPIASRTWEADRFDEFFLGPHGASLDYANGGIRTPKEFHASLVRIQTEPRCDLALLRTQIRESHSTATVSTGQIPKSITRLSPDVHAFRQIWTFKGEKWDRDSIAILDRASRTHTEIFVRSPSDHSSVSLEIRATKAALQAFGR